MIRLCSFLFHCGYITHPDGVVVPVSLSFVRAPVAVSGKVLELEDEGHQRSPRRKLGRHPPQLDPSEDTPREWPRFGRRISSTLELEAFTSMHCRN